MNTNTQLFADIGIEPRRVSITVGPRDDEKSHFFNISKDDGSDYGIIFEFGMEAHGRISKGFKGEQEVTTTIGGSGAKSLEDSATQAAAYMATVDLTAALVGIWDAHTTKGELDDLDYDLVLNEMNKVALRMGLEVVGPIA